MVFNNNFFFGFGVGFIVVDLFIVVDMDEVLVFGSLVIVVFIFIINGNVIEDFVLFNMDCFILIDFCF